MMIRSPPRNGEEKKTKDGRDNMEFDHLGRIALKIVTLCKIAKILRSIFSLKMVSMETRSLCAHQNTKYKWKV